MGLSSADLVTAQTGGEAREEALSTEQARLPGERWYPLTKVRAVDAVQEHTAR